MLPPPRTFIDSALPVLGRLTANTDHAGTIPASMILDLYQPHLAALLTLDHARVHVHKHFLAPLANITTFADLAPGVLTRWETIAPFHTFNALITALPNTPVTPGERAAYYALDNLITTLAAASTADDLPLLYNDFNATWLTYRNRDDLDEYKLFSDVFDAYMCGISYLHHLTTVIATIEPLDLPQPMLTAFYTYFTFLADTLLD